jgi:prevent-host-death family protein
VERLSVVELRQQLAEVMNRAEYQGQRFIIHRRDKDAAAIISIEDLELLERLVRQEEDRIDVAAARDARKDDDYVPYEDFRAETRMTDERREQPVPDRDRRGRQAPARKAAKKGP